MRAATRSRFLSELLPSHGSLCDGTAMVLAAPPAPPGLRLGPSRHLQRTSRSFERAPRAGYHHQAAEATYPRRTRREELGVDCVRQEERRAKEQRRGSDDVVDDDATGYEWPFARRLYKWVKATDRFCSRDTFLRAGMVWHQGGIYQGSMLATATTKPRYRDQD